MLGSEDGLIASNRLYSFLSFIKDWLGIILIDVLDILLLLLLVLWSFIMDNLWLLSLESNWVNISNSINSWRYSSHASFEFSSLLFVVFIVLERR